MKTIKELLTFCNDITFYNHYSIKRVIDKNQMRSCITFVLSECNDIDEKFYLCVLSFIDDTALLFIDKNLENLVHDVNNFRVGCLQLICLEELYKDNFIREKSLDIMKAIGNEKWLQK